MQIKEFIIVFIISVLPFLGMAQPCATGNEKVVSINSQFEHEVLRLTNVERKKHDLQPLVWNEALAYSARYHAQDMALDNYFDHDSFDRTSKGQLKKICGTFTRIEAFYSSNYMAENIAAGRITPEDVVNGWMKSDGHRNNILNGDFNQLGVGYYETTSADYPTYWVQNFGRN